MPREDRDTALLWDMRKAARDISEFMQGITFFHFNSNKMLRYALERQLVVIGEAASHVSETFKKARRLTRLWKLHYKMQFCSAPCASLFVT